MNNSLLRPSGKKLCKQPPTPSEFTSSWTPSPRNIHIHIYMFYLYLESYTINSISTISVALRSRRWGGGGYGYFLKLPNKVKYSVMFPFFFLISLIYLFIHLYFRLFDTWRPMIIWWVKTCFTELHSNWNQENEDPQKLNIRRSETDQVTLSYCFLVNKEVKRKQTNKQTKQCK